MRARRFLALSVVLVVLGAGVAIAQTLPPGGSFLDDDGNVHEPYIEAVAAAGITTGCGEELYCPSAAVSRGQMAAFLKRALQGTLTPGDPVTFVDDDDSQFETDIEWLASVGVTKGCNPPANDQFCPDDPVSRGAMAAFLVRALGLTETANADLFKDDDDSVFEGDIEKLAVAGVTLGCNPPDNDQYCPRDDVQRDAMASFLSRALDLDPIPVEPRTTTTTTIATTTTIGAACDPSYPDVCIPPPPPDLDCGDIPYRNFRVIGSDPHGFDGDGNGVGCET